MSRRFPVRGDRAGAPPGTCPICRAELARGSRVRHLRQEHPAYWRTLLVRVGSPWLFLVIMLSLASVRAPGWTFVAVLIGFIGLSLWARYRSTVERAQRGLGLSGGQWLRGAGIGFMLMSIAFVAVALVWSLVR